MTVCFQEDVGGRRCLFLHGHRNQGYQAAESPSCCRSRTPRLANQAPLQVLDLERNSVPRWRTIALAHAHRTPDLLVPAARSLHTTKVRDQGFCERTSYRTSLSVSLTTNKPFFSPRFHHQT